MTREDHYLASSIERAAENVGAVWPLHSFVTANPLSGFEDRPFHQAVAEAERLFGGRGYPSPDVFRRAWETGRIDPEALSSVLDDHGIDGGPETVLDELDAGAADASSETDSVSRAETDAEEAVDRVLSKWLTAFLDQGQAKWSMPNRDAGFYAAWREMAPHDSEIPDCESPSDLPESPIAALESVLSAHPQGEWETIFEHQLAALPGWTGFIKQRASDDDAPWQSSHPISLTEYLAVRLLVAERLDAPLLPDDHAEAGASEDVPLSELWLTAWERSHRERLLDAVSDADAEPEDGERGDDAGRPDAQFVFCIDTRSEVIRRHVESVGEYETYGYAGFFGIPMRYQGYDADAAGDACPPIVDAQHRITERPGQDTGEARERYDRRQGLLDAGRNVLKALKSNAATAFSFVENAGPWYGAALAARTLFPARVYDALHDADYAPAEREFCEPSIDYNPDAVHALREGLSFEEKVEYAENAFALMGWEEFARLVVFTGHASQTTNNPFGSSLDCGACGGNAGGPNARVLAAVCNDDDVRAELRERGFDIPVDTVFLAAEHDTTTDDITLFDGRVPETHADDLERVRSDLADARERAAAERTDAMTGDAEDSVRETERRAADWAETRPEWGLAGNASFVVGPRDLTADADLDGRTFLHSYDWRTDADGDALEAILTGPLVVTQWINNQYYFATVDNAVYGSGSKATQNPVGNVGVFQGNGGDLMTGLPLQSLYADADTPYHQPLRLTAVVHAPVDRVTDLLRDHDELTRLLDNGWIHLTVLDPEQENAPLHYQGDLEWNAPDEVAAAPPRQTVAADAD
ncbi:DUF2309 domain-containing protein [Salarchaeum sp. JOR-1]|uniref:DUF2309 domain-containing protein n=1 Tax=Salarchaeum sp. JOR-1 TaxID=2599399 RepID=UPI001198B768|nr:DUF2309 domain-containing protein [Salarchaeum sp. JOR-1]QDX41555.1 DUF2309 domain-containing protein [Salarchaeum sp. JOR-1]